jgi:Pectate lyase superfamily protein
MSARLLFANNALTTLAAPITSTATTATLASGTGALFPVPVANQAFLMTFKDAATGLVREIVLVTQMSGDTIVQMARAQEGTTASAYLAGDTAGNYNTAGTQAVFQQAPVSIAATSVQTINSAPTSIKYNLAAGAVTQPLPSISSMAGFDGLTVELWKSDATTNTLTVTTADGFAGFASPLTVTAQGQGLVVEVSVALGKWLVQSFGPSFSEYLPAALAPAIEDLPAAGALTGAELVLLVQGGSAVRSTAGAIGAPLPIDSTNIHYDITGAETAGGVTPTNYADPGPAQASGIINVFRYFTNAQIADVQARTQTQDVTVAIQSACNACSATGGTIYLPYGTYLISSAITVSGSSTHLVGPSRSVTSYGEGAIISASANIEFFTVTGSWVLFENLGLYCSNTGHTHRHIHMTTGNFMSAVNCYIQGVNSAGSATGSGILFDSTSGADGGNVDRCIIDQGAVEVNCSDVHIVDSWCWANTRPYAIKVNGGSNIRVLGCDILPPLTTVSGVKAGIYITNAALQTQVIGCYFDGNGSLSSGYGLLAEAGSIGTIVADCIANLLTDCCIVLDSVITPNVHHNTFYNGNKGRTAINGVVPVDILLRQTGAQPMAQPTISDNKHIYTTTPGGTAAPAIRVITGTAYNGMMIERNSIFSNASGGGYADQEITLDDGLFASPINGSLSKNIGSRKMSCGNGSAAFVSTNTSVTINWAYNLYYQPRVDQIRINMTGQSLAYQVTVLNALQILITFPSSPGSGVVYASVDLN